nr:hypothetical protein [Tanacetum cinerariifolium]
MDNEPNEVRDAIIRRLRTEQEKEYQFVNNLLGEVTRYMVQMLDCAEEEKMHIRVHLPETHPTSVLDYDDEYQQDDIQTNYEDPLTSAMLLLARAITQNFSNLTNNHLRTSSNTRNQAVIQADQVNIQSRNSGNAGRNNRRTYVQ